jgi:hypothetical protein
MYYIRDVLETSLSLPTTAPRAIAEKQPLQQSTCKKVNKSIAANYGPVKPPDYWMSRSYSATIAGWCVAMAKIRDSEALGELTSGEVGANRHFS